MNSREAREILELYRPGVDDRTDPEIAAALELASREPELRRWQEERAALHDALHAKLHQLPVPEGLKEQILSERPRPLPPALRKALIPAAVAALVVVLFLLLYPRPGEDKTFNGFRNRMAAKAPPRAYPKMDLETNDLAEIRRFLAAQGRGDIAVPKALEKATATGCAKLTWQGKPVSMLCFASKAGADPDLFLFVANRADVPKAPRTDSPQVVAIGHLTTASWSLGKKTYVLGGLGNEAFVRPYL